MSKRKLRTYRSWERNHEKIKEAYLRYIQNNKGTSTPTADRIAEETGLHAQTVKNHIKHLKFEPLNHPLRIFTDDVLLNIFEMSKTSAQAAKLWLQVMEGFEEGANVNHTIQKIPPIQFIRAKYDEPEIDKALPEHSVSIEKIQEIPYTEIEENRIESDQENCILNAESKYKESPPIPTLSNKNDVQYWDPKKGQYVSARRLSLTDGY